MAPMKVMESRLRLPLGSSGFKRLPVHLVCPLPRTPFSMLVANLATPHVPRFLFPVNHTYHPHAK